MAERPLDRFAGLGRGDERAALACNISWPLAEKSNKKVSRMSMLIFASPLAVSAMISLWLGFKMRLIMFGGWVSICVAIALLLMRTAFGDGALSKSGLTLLAILIMFQFCSFVMGVLFGRARADRNVE